MAKKSLMLLAAMLGLCVIAWTAVSLRQREPVYHERTLTSWLKECSPNSSNQRAEQAIRQIGTNALPTLLKLVARRESPVVIWLLSFLPEFGIKWLHLRGMNRYLAGVEGDRGLGSEGFAVLGEIAEPAIPSLIALLDDKNTNVRCQAMLALGRIGSAARNSVPSLIRCLNDPNMIIRYYAVSALGILHQDPSRWQFWSSVLSFSVII